MQQQGGGGGGGESSWHNNNNNNNVNMRMGDRNDETTTATATASTSELVESASPISSRPPQIIIIADNNQQQQQSEMVVCNNNTNRWPRQETLALLKIRSEMDATFRDATLKAPLWDHVSRKLAEVGYKRSAKKCKEKFENVHKYYKRTKEGRGGRQHGKTYKFFSELEALQASPNLNPTPMPMPISSFRSPMSIAHNDPTPLLVSSSTIPHTHTNTNTNTISNSFSSNSSDDDMPQAEAEAEADPPASSKSQSESHKRKRTSDDESWSLSMMEFFESLMREVMQKQETLQQKFLDLIEKGDEERKIREEAWKRQEISRLSREHHLMAQERTISASRDAAIVSYLNKITGQTINLPNNPVPVPMDVSEHHQQPQPQDHLVITTPSGVELGGPSSSSLSLSSRWPKPEVLGLIKVRSEMDCKYQEAVPKGPLWEEVSAKMQQMGYIRSAKRCKEKWENINKYFKKVKESSKKRPEDANTCPYFHQLDALYRNKQLNTTTTSREIEAAPSSQSEKTADQLMVDLCDNTDKAAAVLDKKTNIVNELKHDQPLQVDDYNEDQEQEHENQQITGVKTMCLGLDHILQREGQNMTSNEHHNHTSSAFLAIVQ